MAGRVDKTFALGLKARIALHIGSWYKEGYGKSGQTDLAKAKEYFKIAANTAYQIQTEAGRALNPNFPALFTKVGQMTDESKKKIYLH